MWRGMPWITPKSALDGTMLDEEQFSYDDYYSGSSELGRTAVVQVYVDDGGAHAWIEAFIRGRWQVVEADTSVE